MSTLLKTEPLVLHDFHAAKGAAFDALNGMEMVSSYGDVSREYSALRSGAAIMDASFRSRLCITGADRVRFLHGQVTNDIRGLQVGEGCYAALITAKARMQSDLNVFCLADEILLDFEPGLASMVAERLEKYVIADDAQIVDVAPHYGLLTIQGPRAAELLACPGIALRPPAKPFASVKFDHKEFGELYLMNRARLGTAGFDLFIPAAAVTATMEKLAGATGVDNLALCGWEAFETARIEAGIPRFGADMDETNIPLEAGLENGAISFNKGCYIGQEVISRIRTYSEVAKALRGLQLDLPSNALPKKGDKLFREGKEVGYVTSSVFSPSLKSSIALGYVRKDAFEIGTKLRVRTADGEKDARIVDLPFKPA